MRTTGIGILATLLALSWTASASRAADSCGGGCPKLPANARAVSTPGPVPLPAGPPTPFLTATLAKGKKKRLLTVEATLMTSFLAPGAPVSPSLSVDVNGLIMEPSAPIPPGPAITDCLSPDGGGDAPARFSCTVTGSWWIDVDAFPVLINVPLVVTLGAGDFLGPGGVPVVATMTVRQEKK